MIKYSYKDKELKVPTGIGNNNNEGFEEGYDLGYEEGFEVAYPSGYTDGFSDGHVSGVTEQKAKLVSTAITENGTYSREDGFNEVEVDVQPPLETLSVSQSGDVATYTPDDGYYGINSIKVDASGYGAIRWQEGIDWEYNRVSQSAITLSFSGNGEWHKDFFSEVFCNGVIVNVPIDEIYQSGYTSGVTDGFAIGHASGYTDGFYDGHVSGVTDGFASGYASGHSDTDWAAKAMVFNNSGGTWFEPDINLAYLLNGKITFDFYLTETPTTYERRMLLSNFHGHSSTNYLQVCMNDTDMDVWFRDKNGFQTITCDWVNPTAGKLYHVEVSFRDGKIQLSVADGRGNSWTAATSGETDFDYTALGQFIVNGEDSYGDGALHLFSDKLRIINISAYPYSGGQNRYYHWFDGRVKDLMGGTIFTCKKYEDGQIVDTLIDGEIVNL